MLSYELLARYLGYAFHAASLRGAFRSLTALGLEAPADHRFMYSEAAEYRVAAMLAVSSRGA